MDRLLRNSRVNGMDTLKCVLKVENARRAAEFK